MDCGDVLLLAENDVQSARKVDTYCVLAAKKD